MKPLVIYGAANPEIVKLVDAINERKEIWEIIGFLDDVKKGEVTSYMGYPILGGEESITEYGNKDCSFINNVFSTTHNRQLVREKLDKFRVNYATLVSPGVDTRYVHIGADCVILEGVVLGTNVSIGNHVMVRANSTISHDAMVGTYVFVGPGVTICGNVTLGEGAYIGAGSVIKDGVNVGPWSTVGMGSIVNKDVAGDDIVAVAPAKSVKSLMMRG
jgi:sugar O-acyltransferase (sialic acid O-acetyltransferase NeuD family)